jgi:hypothetical protein
VPECAGDEAAAAPALGGGHTAEAGDAPNFPAPTTAGLAEIAGFWSSFCGGERGSDLPSAEAMDTTDMVRSWAFAELEPIKGDKSSRT